MVCRRNGFGVLPAVLTAVLFVPCAARGEAALNTRTAALIESLGSESYATRERASRELTQIGLAAAPYLEQGARHVDLEVRLRCEQILASLRRDDLQRKIDAFASRQPGAEEALPLWKKFQVRLGDGARQRALFVEMVKQEGPLLEILERDFADASARLADRCGRFAADLQAFRQEPPLGSLAMLLLLAGDPQVSIAEPVDLALSSLFSSRGASRTLLDGTDSPLRKLAGQWIRREAVGPNASYSKLNLAFRHALPEGLAPAIRLLETPNRPTTTRYIAIMTVARFGTLEQAPMIEPLLRDASVCSQRFVVERGERRTYTTQIRDVALTALIQLHKQRPQEFGFGSAGATHNGTSPFSASGFETDAEREVVFRKWSQWQSQQKALAGTVKP